MLTQTLSRLEGAEVTISAACTPDGHLYGSVGPREIASALLDEGHSVHADQIKMTQNLKEVGTFQAPVFLADDLSTEIKVWIVAEKSLESLEDGASETEVTDDADADAGTGTNVGAEPVQPPTAEEPAG